MKLTERQSKVLNILVQEYIASAQPVSSQLVEEKYNLGVSPATIRNEMKVLTKSRYLFQPHTSAGRVPTDKGYRLFVDKLPREDSLETKAAKGLDKLIQERMADNFKFLSEFAKTLSEISSNFTILHILKKDLLWEGGWKEILREPEFENRALVFDFADFIENLEKNIDSVNVNSGIKVYIGRESSVPRAKNFSVVSTRIKFPEEGEVIVSILGPTRMNYSKNIGLLNSVIRLFENI